MLTPNVREGFYPLTCCFLSRSSVCVTVESFLSHLLLKAALRAQCHCSRFPDACTARKQQGWDLNPHLLTTRVVCFILELGILQVQVALAPLGNFPAVCPSTNQPTPLN